MIFLQVTLITTMQRGVEDAEADEVLRVWYGGCGLHTAQWAKLRGRKELSENSKIKDF